MTPGKLRHRIQIEKRTTTINNRGGSADTWTALYENCPAHVEQLSGTEAEEARRLAPTSTHKFVIRFHPGLSTQQRIIHNYKIYQIDSINNIEDRNFWQEIICTKSNEILTGETELIQATQYEIVDNEDAWSWGYSAPLYYFDTTDNSQAAEGEIDQLIASGFNFNIPSVATITDFEIQIRVDAPQTGEEGIYFGFFEESLGIGNGVIVLTPTDNQVDLTWTKSDLTSPVELTPAIVNSYSFGFGVSSGSYADEQAFDVTIWWIKLKIKYKFEG